MRRDEHESQLHFLILVEKREREIPTFSRFPREIAEKVGENERKSINWCVIILFLVKLYTGTVQVES